MYQHCHPLMFCVPAERHQSSIFCFSSSYYTYLHLSFVQHCSFPPALIPCYHPSNFCLPLLWYLVPETCFWDLAESAIASAAVENLLLKALRGAATWPPWFQSSRLFATPHSFSAVGRLVASEEGQTWRPKCWNGMFHFPGCTHNWKLVTEW